jgi:MFS transporter, PAT family, beta-lactamase induction signal transducer AmpG
MPPEPPKDPVGQAGVKARPRSTRTLLWTSSTYFGEGLPWSFLHQMGTEFLTDIGASKTQIGSTSLLHLSTTLKFAWSPVVDLFGKKRTWLLATQFTLGLGMFAIAAISPSRNLTLFWSFLAVLAIIHATHDIACDGFYLQMLDRAQQALFAGVRTAAFRLAMIVGASPLVYLAGKTNWLLGFGAAGALMILVAILNTIVTPRPPESRAEDQVRDRAKGHTGTAILAAYVSFFTQPQAVVVLLFMFSYKLGDLMMFAMSRPLMRDIGIDTAHRGILNGIGTVCFIVASLIGGALIARRGLARCLVPMTYFQNLAIPLYIGIAVLKPHFATIIPIYALEQFAAGIGASAHVVFLMQRCRAAFSASHYAFASALVAFGSTLAGFLSGPLNEALGHPLFFTVAFIASVPSLVLVLLVPKTPVEPGPAVS